MQERIIYQRFLHTVLWSKGSLAGLESCGFDSTLMLEADWLYLGGAVLGSGRGLRIEQQVFVAGLSDNSTDWWWGSADAPASGTIKYGV